MSLLQELRKARDFYVSCPSCGHEFPVAKAELFDATGPLPTKASKYLKEQREEIKGRNLDLRNQKKWARSRPETGAASSTTGKVIEKIAPSLPGFPVAVGDCRALFEPIDYVVFKGLSSKGEIDALLFVDVKHGDGRLGDDQRQIRKLVHGRKVELNIRDHGKEDR